MENNKMSMEWIQQEVPKNMKIWVDLAQKPREALASIYAKKEFDWLQIALITLLNVIISLIVGRGVGSAIGSIIGTPLGIFVGGAFLLFLTWVGKGNTQYLPLVNIVAYANTFNVLAGLFTRVPFIGGLITLAAGIYVLFLQIIGVIEEAKADKKRVLITLGIILGICILGGVLIAIAGFAMVYYTGIPSLFY